MLVQANEEEGYSKRLIMKIIGRKWCVIETELKTTPDYNWVGFLLLSLKRQKKSPIIKKDRNNLCTGY